MPLPFIRTRWIVALELFKSSKKCIMHVKYLKIVGQESEFRSQKVEIAYSVECLGGGL